MRAIRLLATSAAAAVVSVLAPAVAADAAAAPAASVDITSPGKIGRFDTAIVTIAQSCRSGAVVSQLSVTVRQGTLSGTRTGKFGAVCDGATHRVQVEVTSSTGDKFVPGAADVSARFTVQNAPAATDSARITLLAPAEADIGQEARVGRFGSVIVPLNYRCQVPWIVSELDVEVTQGSVGGLAFRDSGLRCDARWHHIEMGVSSDTGYPFVRGYADIDVRLTVQDPVSFDPVWQAHDQQRTWVSPAARITVDSARRFGAKVQVALSVRCQRPWVVAEWTVEVTQRNDRVEGFIARQTGFTCDAAWHKLSVTVTGSAAFTAGSTTVAATLDVQDPVSFDPVDQATDRKVFTLS